MDCRTAHLARGIVEKRLALCRVHLAEQITGLLVVVVIDAVIPVGDGALDLERRLVEIGLIGPFAPAVWEVGRRAAEIAVRAHRAVAMVTVERAFRRVDRDMVEVDAEPVTLGVGIGEQPRLQHLVGREADARHDVGRRECGLLDFGKYVRLVRSLPHRFFAQRAQVGTVDHTPVYPREVVKRALELSATAVILVHNHPSGDPTPSRADIQMTQAIVEVARPLGIAVHDHIIVGKDGHASLKALKLI